MNIRELYEFINFAMSLDILPYKKRLELTKKYKQDVRRIVANAEKQDIIHYSDDGESCWIKEFFNEPFTEEEKREFIEDHWIHIYSPYDCTGKWFTCGIEICNFKEPNSFGAMSVVYHLMGLDV